LTLCYSYVIINESTSVYVSSKPLSSTLVLVVDST